MLLLYSIEAPAASVPVLGSDGQIRLDFVLENPIKLGNVKTSPPLRGRVGDSIGTLLTTAVTRWEVGGSLPLHNVGGKPGLFTDEVKPLGSGEIRRVRP